MEVAVDKGVSHTSLKRLLTGILVAVGACAPAPANSPARDAARNGGLEVSTDRASYRAGEPLTLTVYNRGADTVAFNPCTRTLEAERGNAWTVVPEAARICTMEAWLLAPGETRAGPTELPADLVAGRYRAVLGFSTGSAEPSAGKLEARTDPFTVER
jgi:hypothetical protein